MSRPVLLAVVALFLLTPLASIDVGAQAPTKSGTDLVVEDPAGDVMTRAFLTGTTAGAPLDHIDLRSLRIGGETAGTFEVEFDLEGWDETVSTTVERASVNPMGCILTWTYAGELDYQYTLSVRMGGLADTGERTFTSTLSFWTWEDEYNSDFTYQGQTLAYDPDSHTLTATIDKSFVPAFPGPEPVGKGITLRPFYAQCATDTALLVYHYDMAEVGNKGYAFVEEGAGSVVRVGFGSASDMEASLNEWQFPEGSTGGARTSIAPGQQSLVPVRLENRAEAKRLVLLSARPVDDAAGWNTTIAPSIFLKGGEVRNVNLIVTPPSDAALGSTVEVEVRAELAGGEGAGAASQRLVVAPQLSAANNVLHVHAEPAEYGDLDPLFPVIPGYMLRMSLLEQEDGYSDAPFGPGPLFSLWSTVHMDALGRPVRLAEEEATLQFEVVGDPGSMLDLQFNFGDADAGTLYSHMGTYEVGTHTVPLVPHYEGLLDLAAGTRLFGDLYLAQRSSVLAAQIDPKATKLTLPVRDVEAGLNVTDGRFLPNLALGTGEDKLTYINPGKEYAFDLVLSNDGIEEDDLQVAVSAANATGWTIEVLPGARFRVPAGESTPVTIDVIAPTDAKEGETVVIKVQADSKKDADAHASITLTAIATGVAVDDKPYVEKEDQLAPLAEDEKEAPAALALLAVLATLGLLHFRRRA